MFDIFVSDHRNTTGRATAPLVVSWVVHAIAIGALVVGPLLYATDSLPEVPDRIMAFVATPPAPPPPPPPPPPAPAPAAEKRPTPPKPRAPRPAPTTAPEELPPRDVPAAEPAVDPLAEAFSDLADLEGSGVAGGVPGGVLGGVVGGIPNVPPPPPPAPPREPIRTGGQIQPPALVKRVPPVYPPVAVDAGVEGVVILEATVGRDGHVEEVEVLRSVPLLDRAAMDAVRQWQYEPLLLNGRPERFILTVTVSFSLT